MKKWLAVAVVLLVVAVFARNWIARIAVQTGTHRITGFPLTIDSVRLGLLNGQLDVTGLKLMNPEGFDEKQFVDVRKLHVDYRLGSMLTGSPHVNDMIVDIHHLVIVKNGRGESNAQRLRGVTSSDKPSTAKYQIDRLSIHIGKVSYKDFSRNKSWERELNITANYKDITDSTDITRLVLLTTMSQARLPDIGVQPDDLKKSLGNVQTAAGELIKSGVGLLDTLKQTAQPK